MNIEKIDALIAPLEQRLSELRTMKVSLLKAELAKLENQVSSGGTASASSASASAPAAAPAKRGRKPGSGRKAGSGNKAAAKPVADAKPAAPAKRAGKKGTGKRGKRLSHDEVITRLTAAVRAAGSEGISARQAAANSGVFYLRALDVMDKAFRKTGTGKWTRYTIKG
jgi:hypothetical protein